MWVTLVTSRGGNATRAGGKEAGGREACNKWGALLVNSDTLVTWRLGKPTWAAIGILGAKLGATKAGAKLGAKLRPTVTSRVNKTSGH